MAGELGEDHVLLIRKHPSVTDRLPRTGTDFLLDVSAYPDIQELYLVADMLITDYSSAMFDFAVTGKPMFFFTYDLEHYRDEVRGFYFDFEAEAPGRCCGRRRRSWRPYGTPARCTPSTGSCTTPSPPGSARWRTAARRPGPWTGSSGNHPPRERERPRKTSSAFRVPKAPDPCGAGRSRSGMEIF